MQVWKILERGSESPLGFAGWEWSTTKSLGTGSSPGEQQLGPAELGAAGMPLEARWSLCSAADGSSEHAGAFPD